MNGKVKSPRILTLALFMFLIYLLVYIVITHTIKAHGKHTRRTLFGSILLFFFLVFLCLYGFPLLPPFVEAKQWRCSIDPLNEAGSRPERRHGVMASAIKRGRRPRLIDGRDAGFGEHRIHDRQELAVGIKQFYNATKNQYA